MAFVATARLRAQQSVMSESSAHEEYSEPWPPSSQKPFLADSHESVPYAATPHTMATSIYVQNGIDVVGALTAPLSGRPPWLVVCLLC